MLNIIFNRGPIQNKRELCERAKKTRDIKRIKREDL